MQCHRRRLCTPRLADPPTAGSEGPQLAAASLQTLWLGFRSLFPQHKQCVVHTNLANIVPQDLLPLLPRYSLHSLKQPEMCAFSKICFLLDFDVTTPTRKVNGRSAFLGKSFIPYLELLTCNAKVQWWAECPLYIWFVTNVKKIINHHHNYAQSSSDAWLYYCMISLCMLISIQLQ